MKVLLLSQTSTLRIATWNINSVRLRIHLLTDWLRETKPDIVCLQEIKCVDEAFPYEEIEACGYNIAVHGQKSYNGVALLSKYPLEDVQKELNGNDEDDQARYIEAVVSVNNTAVRVASIYMPNGNPIDTPKYEYKLKFMEGLIAHAKLLLTYEEKLILAGDYNVIPHDKDCYDPKVWANDALFLPAIRAKFQELISLGLTDALRATSDEAGLYTFWDYQAGAWPKNLGIRIDHLLLSPEAADSLVQVQIDKDMRTQEKPSDHVPIWADVKV